MEKIKIDDPSGNIIYINKESMEFDFMTSAQELNDYVIANSKDEQQNYIFIDEIQDIVGFEKALRSLLLDENNDIL
jgi:predicted AAA+ superfamily ATPase